jgi:hypothetical protein
MPEKLDIRVEAEKLRTMYEEQKLIRRICALVLGMSGHGKTRLLETAVRPIHIDSFDPQGTDTIRKGIKEGWIIVDTRYEREDPLNPFVFEEWDRIYHERKANGYFENFGTYCLDPLSTFFDAIMNLVLKGLVRRADRGVGGKSGNPIFTELLKIPQENDWPIQMNIMYRAISDIVNTIPCDVLITGHIEYKKDKKGNIISRGLYATGTMAGRIPRLFQEVYVMKSEDSSGGPVYNLFTQPIDGVDARTRIGRDIFDYRERPDIMYLLEKAGLNPKHKEIPWLK